MQPIFPLETRLLHAFSTVPNRNDWIWTLSQLAIFCVSAIPLGVKFGLLKVEFPSISLWIIARIALVAFIFPSIAEEIFFRVLFLPQASEQSSLSYKILAVLTSLILFVLYHPLNAALFMKSARETFYDFHFLALALMLGIVCTIAYFKSGSVYPPTFLHWVIVMGWLFCFGGYQRLYP